MLATALPAGAPAPSGPEWVHEVKWDGARVLAGPRSGLGPGPGPGPGRGPGPGSGTGPGSVDAGRGLRLSSRTGREVTSSFPELGGLAELTGPVGGVLLDGEVVALDAAGRPSFGVLQERLHVARPSAALVARVPVTCVVFDVLAVGGRDLTGAPLGERRAVLDALDLAGGRVPGVTTSPLHDDGAALWAATAAQGLEGVVAKRLDSPYEPGRRSPAWVKRAHRARRTVLVGGWRPQVGTRTHLGALLVGAPDASGALRYLGRVGSGVAGALAELLTARLAPLALPVGFSPFADPVPRADATGATWCAPLLAVEVRHLGWTTGGRLRQATALGVREDAPVDAAPDLER